MKFDDADKTYANNLGSPPVTEQPKIVTGGELYHQSVVPPQPPPAYPQQYGNSQYVYYQGSSGIATYQGQPHYVYQSQPDFYTPRDNKLRIPALVLAALSCCCGAWLCSIPALILAILPECDRSRGSRAMYIGSIVLSILAIITAIIIIIIVVVAVRNNHGYYTTTYSHHNGVYVG